MLYIGFIIQAVVLWIILFILARDSAGRSYSTMFYVSLGVTLIAIGLHFTVPKWDLPAAAAVSVLLIRSFCHTTWLRAIIAGALFFAWLHYYPAILKHAIPDGALPSSVAKPIDLDENP